ncbi:hypothetical protein B0H14DRAFT_2572120 [Mycena olivaceomarginata]|nr:hypothetical protein B0H14DRAFT_2572120 [Mycena olivaceomarginata]
MADTGKGGPTLFSVDSKAIKSPDTQCGGRPVKNGCRERNKTFAYPCQKLRAEKAVLLVVGIVRAVGVEARWPFRLVHSYFPTEQQRGMPSSSSTVTPVFKFKRLRSSHDTICANTVHPHRIAKSFISYTLRTLRGSSALEPKPGQAQIYITYST